MMRPLPSHRTEFRGDKREKEDEPARHQENYLPDMLVQTSRRRVPSHQQNIPEGQKEYHTAVSSSDGSPCNRGRINHTIATVISINPPVDSVMVLAYL